MRRTCLAVALLSLASLAISVCSAQTPAPKPPPPCSTPEYRQFDFWLGRWEVTSPKGQAQGTNEITREMGDCVLHEHWVGSQGGSGESFNTYDRTRGVWHQTWVDAQGTLLLLEGGLRGPDMVMEGELPGAGGKPVRQRITWSPKPGGEVHQHWETSPDRGTTWATAFYGIYRRAKD